MKNRAVAELLREIADFLEMQDVDWKPRAYRRAARSIEALSDPIEDYHDRGELESIDDIGEAIAAKIAEYLDTGELAYYEELKAEVPVDVEALTAVEGLGPTRVKHLYDALGITTLDELEAAAQAGDIAGVEGFGEKSQANILDHIGMARKGQERMLLGDVFPIADDLERRLRGTGTFVRVVVAGSFRRRKPTVGDLDVLATADDPDAAMDAFTSLDDIDEVLSRGDTKAAVILAGSLHVDLRIVDDDSFGAALQYFTGSKDHNVTVRSRALDRDMALNEYGLFQGGTDGDRVAGATEAEVYEALDLAPVPPELREDTGEVQAAADDALPDLVETDEVRGDLQIHTEWSDGNASVREMAEAAQERGLDYILITDHGPGLAVADGLQDLDDVQEQRVEIERVDDELDITVLQGIEADIVSGGLDISPEMADAVDLVVASIHRVPKNPTSAVLAALEGGMADIWAHPRNRKLNEREPVRLDLDELMPAAARNQVAVEINAQPRRLDLDWRNVKEHRGTVQYVISTDAHRPAALDYMHLGVSQARRGWCEAEDILNTRPLDDLRGFFG